MKLFIPFFCIFLLFPFVVKPQKIQQNKRETDKDGRELVGNVHSVRIQRILAYGNEFDGGWIPSLTIYNQNGFVQKFTAYNDKDELDYESISEFDSSGNKIQETDYDKNKKILRRTIRNFDARGNMIEIKQYGNADLSLISWGKFLYNDKDYLISHTYFNKLGQPLGTTKHLYYRDWKKKGYVSHNPSGKLTHQTNIYYKDKNIETVVFDKPRTIKFRHVSLVNETGDRVQLTYNKNGKILFKGNYSYERDEHGNWIKELCSEWRDKDGVLILKRVKITTRTITYY